MNFLPVSSQISALATGRQHDLYVMPTQPEDRLKAGVVSDETEILMNLTPGGSDTRTLS